MKKVKKVKQKTKKAAQKRIKVTGTGKLMRYSSGRRHLLEHKSPGKKRNKRGTTELHKTNQKAFKGMLPGV